LTDISADIWVLPIYRYQPQRSILSASVGVNRTLLHSSRIQTTCARKHNEASQQLSYSNASMCGLKNKQTRLTMWHASAVTAETKTSLGSFAMLEATMSRCCLQINSCCASASFCRMKSLTVT